MGTVTRQDLLLWWAPMAPPLRALEATFIPIGPWAQESLSPSSMSMLSGVQRVRENLEMLGGRGDGDPWETETRVVDGEMA